MGKDKGKPKPVNLSIDLPEDIAAVIEHHAIMTGRSSHDILREVVDKMIRDNWKEAVKDLEIKP